MQALAAWLGVLIGSALREALPAIVAVYREFRRATVEDAATDLVLQERLVALARAERERMYGRNPNDPGTERPAGPDSADSPSGPGVGPGGERRPGRG
jgi:hypothetical protein